MGCYKLTYSNFDSPLFVSANNFTSCEKERGSMYDLFFRNYDPAIGRMLQVDPMASKYASLSPYNYAFNDPVFWNDPTGADPWDHFWQVIERLWNEAPIDGGGAGWSVTGGFTGAYGNDEAFYVGAEYLDQHNGWDANGFASNFESASGAYASATGGAILLREITIQEARTNTGWLQQRIDETYQTGNGLGDPPSWLTDRYWDNHVSGWTDQLVGQILNDVLKGNITDWSKVTPQSIINKYADPKIKGINAISRSALSISKGLLGDDFSKYQGEETSTTVLMIRFLGDATKSHEANNLIWGPVIKSLSPSYYHENIAPITELWRKFGGGGSSGGW